MSPQNHIQSCVYSKSKPKQLERTDRNLGLLAKIEEERWIRQVLNNFFDHSNCQVTTPLLELKLNWSSCWILDYSRSGSSKFHGFFLFGKTSTHTSNTTFYIETYKRENNMVWNNQQNLKWNFTDFFRLCTVTYIAKL